MLKRILRLLLPTTLYVWIFMIENGKHIDWEEAKCYTWVHKRFYPIHLLSRAAAWAMVICGSYFAAHVIHAIVQGRLP